MSLITQQRGATLIVALIFLVILIVVGLSSLSTSTYEIKTAQSVKGQMEAFNLAEDALVQGEKLVCVFQLNNTSSTSAPSTVNCDGGFAGFGGWQGGFDTATLVSMSSLSQLIGTSAASVSSDQKVYIEYLGTVIPSGTSVNMGQSGGEKRYLFRVTGYASPSSGGHKVVQSYYMTTD